MIANFKMSYADLVQLGDKALNLYDRDNMDLQRFGITLTERSIIEAQTNNLRHFPTDEELRGLQVSFTAKKDEARVALLKGISDIMFRVNRLYGNNSPEYRRYGTKDMYTQDDANLVLIGYRVHRVALEQLASLSQKGLTNIELTEFKTKVEQFDNAIDQKSVAVRTRDSTQQDRLIIANELYLAIVELFAAGKQLYEGVDDARYNDYVIYTRSSEETTNSMPEEDSE